MKLLKQLRATNSNPEKKALLANIEYIDWRTFVYAYHPELTYHLKLPVYDELKPGEPTKEMFELLDKILNEELKGNNARQRVQAFSETNGELIKLIINKDLRCGISATSFNAVHKGSIPQYKAMKAKEVPLKDLEYPLLAQLKYDGVRLIAHVQDGNITLRTYNGKIVPLPDLEATIKIVAADNYILDGEITYGDGKLEGRSSISGTINSAIHGGTVDETEMVFYVFDTMSKLEFDAEQCSTPYMDRFTILKALVAATITPSFITRKNQDMYIQVAITNEVHNYEGAQQLYDGATALGYEGLILKKEDHIYEFKRSKNWVKAKAVKTADLTCTEVLGGSGKYEDMIGALTCEGTVEGKQVKVNVGSGLSDYQRDMDDGAYLYHTIEVKYNSIIQDRVTQQWSLFLPRFVKVRLDK